MKKLSTSYFVDQRNMGAEQIDASKIEDAHISCDLVTPSRKLC